MKKLWAKMVDDTLLTLIVLVVTGLVIIFSCSALESVSETKEWSRTKDYVINRSSVKKDTRFVEPIFQENEFSNAVIIAKPEFNLGGEITLNGGAIGLYLWMEAKGTKFSEFKNMTKTSYDEIRMDVESASGKILCDSGFIVDIEKLKDGVHMGEIFCENGIIRFLSVGSAGNLSKDSGATYCGVVTGTESYENSKGDVINTVRTVGMFKFPENM